MERRARAVGRAVDMAKFLKANLYVAARMDLLAEIERVEWEMREGKMLPHPAARKLIQSVRSFVGTANSLYEETK